MRPDGPPEVPSSERSLAVITLRPFKSLALVLSVLLASVSVASADGAAEQAKALLRKGVGQYKDYAYESAKATLLKVDADALSTGARRTLAVYLKRVDPAIRKKAEAVSAFNNATKAKKAGRLAEAKAGFTKAAKSEFLPPSVRKDARAELAHVEKRIVQATADKAAKAAADKAKAADLAK